MKKQNFILLIIFNFLLSDTILEEGDIWGTLRQEDSPFIINGYLWVMEDSVLTIEPGCRFLFNHPLARIFCVNANIHAIGTEEDSIIFTRSSPDVSWGGFIFSNHNSTNQSIFEYCTIEWTGHNLEYGGRPFDLTACDITLRNVLIRDNDVSAVNVGLTRGPIRLWDSRITIENSVIRDNGDGEENWFSPTYGGGASIENPRPGSIIKNSIFYNNLSNWGGGIDIGLAGDNLIFENNIVAYNNAIWGGGISLLFGSYPIIKNSIILNNDTYSWYSPIMGESIDNHEHNQIYASSNFVIESSILSEDDCLFFNQTVPEGYGCDYPDYDFMNTDPMFVDADNGDFRLLPQSPAINAGTGDPDPDGSPPDIGAIYFHLTKGDVNFDEVINMLDIVYCIQFIVENITPWNSQIWSMDMNDDGNLNVLDIIPMTYIILGDH